MTEEDRDQPIYRPCCGGCGKLFLAEPPVTFATAKEQTRMRRCRTCKLNDLIPPPTWLDLAYPLACAVLAGAAVLAVGLWVVRMF